MTNKLVELVLDKFINDEITRKIELHNYKLITDYLSKPLERIFDSFLEVSTKYFWVNIYLEI